MRIFWLLMLFWYTLMYMEGLTQGQRWGSVVNVMVFRLQTKPMIIYFLFRLLFNPLIINGATYLYILLNYWLLFSMKDLSSA